jgi:hypothetical protein
VCISPEGFKIVLTAVITPRGCICVGPLFVAARTALLVSALPGAILPALPEKANTASHAVVVQTSVQAEYLQKRALVAATSAVPRKAPLLLVASAFGLPFGALSSFGLRRRSPGRLTYPTHATTHPLTCPQPLAWYCVSLVSCLFFFVCGVQ